MTNQFIGRHESFEGTRKELSVNQISLRARIEGRPMRLYYHFISFCECCGHNILQLVDCVIAGVVQRL